MEFQRDAATEEMEELTVRRMKKFGSDGRTPGPPGEEVWIKLT